MTAHTEELLEGKEVVDKGATPRCCCAQKRCPQPGGTTRTWTPSGSATPPLIYPAHSANLPVPADLALSAMPWDSKQGIGRNIPSKRVKTTGPGKTSS